MWSYFCSEREDTIVSWYDSQCTQGYSNNSLYVQRNEVLTEKRHIVKHNWKSLHLLLRDEAGIWDGNA